MKKSLDYMNYVWTTNGTITKEKIMRTNINQEISYSSKNDKTVELSLNLKHRHAMAKFLLGEEESSYLEDDAITNKTKKYIEIYCLI